MRSNRRASGAGGWRPARSAERGFSLVEVMIAIVFLGIGLLAVAQMMPLASSQIVSSRSETKALQAAESSLEELKTSPYSSPTLSAGTHSSTSNGRTVTYNVTDNKPLTGVKRIELTVSWKENGKEKTLSFVTHVVHQ